MIEAIKNAQLKNVQGCVKALCEEVERTRTHIQSAGNALIEKERENADLKAELARQSIALENARDLHSGWFPVKGNERIKFEPGIYAVKGSTKATGEFLSCRTKVAPFYGEELKAGITHLKRVASMSDLEPLPVSEPIEVKVGTYSIPGLGLGQMLHVDSVHCCYRAPNGITTVQRVKNAREMLVAYEAEFLGEGEV